MPFSSSPLGDLVFWDCNGNRMDPIATFDNVTMTSDEPVDGELTKINLGKTNIEFKISIPKRFARTMERMAYSWKARGPIRKKLFWKLIRQGWGFKTNIID